MTSKKIRAIGAAALALVWVALTVFAWFKPADDISSAERRKLAQMPAINGDTLLSGSFMSDFEKYTTDQFPLRDTFRFIKATFNNSVLQQMDNNDIYVANGYAAEMLYPLDEGSVRHALQTFNNVYDLFIKDKGCNVYVTVVPDKNYYLAEGSGHLRMDYETMFAMMQSGIPASTYIDITGTLSIEDYYFTDTHWRQECLVPTAQVLCQAMGVTPPQESDYTPTPIARPFYGVYHGQAALPLPAETMYVMHSQLINGCRAKNYVASGASVIEKMGKVYDMSKQGSMDLYDVFLSGTNALMRIENPKATSGRELIVFRDSFGSSMAPLLLSDYAAVTLIDLRYVNDMGLLGQKVDFTGKDVLFMPSSLVLNKNLL